MKKIVVTGATSFIGVHLIEKLLDGETKIIAIVRPNSPNITRLPAHEDLEIVELEIQEMKLIGNKISGEIDAFYHLAWEGARAPYRDDKELQEKNYFGAIDAMKAALALKVKVFVGSGSQAEYGKFNGKVNEEYPCNPITEYGKAKYEAYCNLSKIAEENHIKFIWTRIFSVYGKYDFSGTLVMSSIDKMRRHENMQMTECIQNWDFVFVEDVAEALVRFIMVDCESGVYNVASGIAKPLKDFVEELKSILESRSGIEYGKIPYAKEGPVSFEPEVIKMESALQWKANTSFRDGIKKILESTNE